MIERIERLSEAEGGPPSPNLEAGDRRPPSPPERATWGDLAREELGLSPEQETRLEQAAADLAAAYPAELDEAVEKLRSSFRPPAGALEPELTLDVDDDAA